MSHLDEVHIKIDLSDTQCESLWNGAKAMGLKLDKTEHVWDELSETDLQMKNKL